MDVCIRPHLVMDVCVRRGFVPLHLHNIKCDDNETKAHGLIFTRTYYLSFNKGIFGDISLFDNRVLDQADNPAYISTYINEFED